MRDYALLPALGQPVDEGREQVLLHRKPAIGRLDPVGPAYAADLGCEPALAVEIADVLDHRVAEDHVEGAIAERQRAAVGRLPIGRARIRRRAAC